MVEEAFGEQASSQTRTFEWSECFKDGLRSVEDDKYSGPISTITTLEVIAKVRAVILEDRLSMMFVIALDCHTGHINAL